MCAAVQVVRAAVCGNAHGSVRAVRVAAVCDGSALGSVRQCAWQCAAIRQCDSVAVRGSAAVCGSVPKPRVFAVPTWYRAKCRLGGPGVVST
jgi:hypothetical protein